METAEPPPWGCFPVSFCYCRWDAAIERLSGVFLSCDGLWDRVNTGVNSLLLCSHCPVGLNRRGHSLGTYVLGVALHLYEDGVELAGDGYRMQKIEYRI